MRTRVKICGVTDGDTIAASVQVGVDALGFVLTDSPRQLSLREARKLIDTVPPFVSTVAVMRHPSVTEVGRVLLEVNPTLIQTEPHPDFNGQLERMLPVFHDSEHVTAVIDAFGKKSRHHCIHLEGPGRGGRGISVNIATAKEIAARHRLVIAGGLNAENVAAVIEEVRPYGVDVSSGVESAPGKKHVTMIRDFMRAVRDADAAIGVT